MIYYFQAGFSTITPVLTPGEALQDQIHAAVKALRNGGVVAIPTDTLYGLAASAFDQMAVERVFRLKGRSTGAALPLLLAEPDDIYLCAADIPELTWRLVERFWPGALTLVLRKRDAIPDVVSGGMDTVAVRVPDHSIPRAIVRALGMPVTGTSANRTGSSGLASAREVRDEFGAEVDLVIDGGNTPGGLPSTVLDLTGDHPRILRHGSLTHRELEESCGIKLSLGSVPA